MLDPCRPRTEAGQIVARHIRAPSASGAKLIEPPLDCVPKLLEANAACQGRCEYDFGGRRLGRLAAEARQELVREAARYTSSYRDVPDALEGKRILLAGHQPQMFHPGVWFKNFVLGRLAEAHDAVGVNLVIDSDTIKSVSVRVPKGDVTAPLMESIEFDRPGPIVPFEERPILDRDTLTAFGNRVGRTLVSAIHEPLVQQYWPLVLERAGETDNLGNCLAQARHQLEGHWGLRTLEFPQSHVCQLEAFHWFTAHLLAHLPRLWSVYNEAVAQYRRAYKLRSANHPVPDLAQDGDLLEAPYWIWTAEAPQRCRLFVGVRDNELLLTNRAGWEARLPAGPDADLTRAAAVLADLSAQGIKLRTRALITTLFGRLLLGDLFLHGIGGGKYDELTDLLMARFFDLEPPRFMVISGTLHLPVTQENVKADDVRRIDHLLRELEFHPERWLEPSSPAEAASIDNWAAQKRRWIDTPASPSNARARTRAIRQANDELQPYLAGRRQQLQVERSTIVEHLQARSVWSSRDYAFCLYPEQALRKFLLDFPNDKP